MDEVSGVRYDSYTGSHDLTPEEAPGEIESVAGKIGNAAHLDEVVQYLHTAEDDLVVAVLTQFTVAFWIEISGKGIGSIFTHQVMDNIELFLNNSHSGTDQYILFYMTLSGPPDEISIWVNLESHMAEWVFCTMTWAVGRHAEVRINNGSPIIDTATPGTAALATPEGFWAIGNYEGGGASPDIKVDSFSIWNRVLSSDEQTRLYNGGAGLSYPF